MERKCKHHGAHEKWQVVGVKAGRVAWLCKLCGSQRSREKSIAVNYARLLNDHGKSIADRYLEETKTRQIRINGFLSRLKDEQDYGRSFGASYYIKNRIQLLNIASNKALSNLGWSCSECGLTHKHPSFFDIDRIVPGNEGGQYVPDNMKLLCANCHRCKTKKIVGGWAPIFTKKADGGLGDQEPTAPKVEMSSTGFYSAHDQLGSSKPH